MHPRAEPDDDAFRASVLAGLSDAGLGLVVTDGRTILSVNDALARMVGRAPQELVGLDTTFLVPAEERDEGRARQDARLATRQPQSFRCHFERADGGRVLVEVTGKPLRGDPPRFVAIVRDLTEEEAARRELEEARRLVARSEKLSALGSLVSGVAHEVRTPLTYLKNNLFLLERRLDRVAASSADAAALRGAREQMQETIEAAERIERLIDDLRRFTRQSPGARRVAPLDHAVREAVTLFEATHRGRVRLRAELAPTPATLVDALETQQVVLNLLENASDASPPGAAVRVRTRAATAGATLEVEDEGAGIPPEVQQRMWEPFFTTKPDGTGLGLSVVRRIAESAGAQLACESAPGRGTRIVLRFHEKPPSPVDPKGI